MCGVLFLVCFDIFKHHRRSGTVDKIKKYRRDIPWGFLSTSAVDKNPFGNPSRYSLL